MPKQINPLSDRQLVFRDNYCKNGHNALKAYIDAGYSKTNASGHAHRLVVKGSMKKAIKAFMDKCSEKAGWTVERSQELLLKTYKQATVLKQPSAAVSAITAVNRLYGMDKDAGGGTEAKALELSKDALSALRDEAAIVNKQSIAKPSLYKEQA